jgi:hypothetical protein
MNFTRPSTLDPRLLAAWLLLLCCLAAMPLPAAVILEVPVQTITGRHVTNTPVTLTLTDPLLRVNGTNAVSRIPQVSYATTNTPAYFSNVLWGSYRLTIDGTPSTTYKLTVGTNLSGVVNFAAVADNPSTNLPPNSLTNYYTQANVDALIDSIDTGGGGGSATNVYRSVGAGGITVLTNGLLYTISNNVVDYTNAAQTVVANSTNALTWHSFTVAGTSNSVFVPTNYARIVGWVSTNSYKNQDAGTVSAQGEYRFRYNIGSDAIYTNTTQTTVLWSSDHDLVWRITNAAGSVLYTSADDSVLSSWTANAGSAPPPTFYIPTNSITNIFYSLNVSGAPLRFFPTNNCIYVDSASGNDASGQPYNPVTPFRTLHAAVGYLQPNNGIVLSSGNYTITNTISLGTNFLVGMGLGITTISSDFQSVNGWINLKSKAIISGLTLASLTQTGNVYTVPIQVGTASDWVSSDVEIKGFSDGYYLIGGTANGKIIRPSGSTQWDYYADFNTAPNTGLIEVFDPNISVNTTQNFWGSSYDGANAFKVGSTALRIVGGSIKSSSVASNAWIYVADADASVELSGVTLIDGGGSKLVNSVGGSVSVKWGSNPTNTVGTITPTFYAHYGSFTGNGVGINFPSAGNTNTIAFYGPTGNLTNRVLDVVTNNRAGTLTVVGRYVAEQSANPGDNPSRFADGFFVGETSYGFNYLGYINPADPSLAALNTNNGISLTNLQATNIVGGVVTQAYTPVLTLNGGLLLTNLATGSWIRETNGIITIGPTNGTANITINGNSGTVVISGTSSTIGGNTLPGWSGTGPFVAGRLLMDLTGNGNIIKTTGIDVTNPAFQGTLTATNGVASFSQTAPVNIAATGWTNIWSTNNAVVYFDGTAVTMNIVKADGTGVYTNATALGNGQAHLHPGWWLILSGTGVTGRAVPF